MFGALSGRNSGPLLRMRGRAKVKRSTAVKTTPTSRIRPSTRVTANQKRIYAREGKGRRITGIPSAYIPVGSSACRDTPAERLRNSSI